jgi:hypothetical protein
MVDESVRRGGDLKESWRGDRDSDGAKGKHTFHYL